MVQVSIPGHYDYNAAPLYTDTTALITNTKAFADSIDMYCYQAQYTLKEGEGQRTRLYFCKKGTIVSDIRVTPATVSGNYPAGN